ncbi:Protein DETOXIFICATION (Multidrug and toxic compound extrusion protein), partial [Psidium guajava]
IKAISRGGAYGFGTPLARVAHHFAALGDSAASGAMSGAQLPGASVSSGPTSRQSELSAAIRRKRLLAAPARASGVCSFSAFVDRKRFYGCGCRLSANHRWSVLLSVRSQLSSDCGIGFPDVDEYVGSPSVGDELLLRDDPRTNKTEEAAELTAISQGQSHITDVKKELVALSLPALAGQAIEPLAQLMETAYIGRLGAVELGSAGVSMSIFNIISKLFNIPLLSVATSFVAEDLSKNASKDSASDEGILESNGNHTGKPFTVAERKQLSSVSTALLLAVGIGIFEAIALYFGSGQFLNLMGVSSASPMRSPAQRILSLRALGAPAVVLSLALQGIFRGFKDTKTPVLCLGIGNLAAVFLFPVLMYGFRLGVVGAALSTVVSQYLVALLMIWYLSKRVILLPPKVGALQFGGYIKSGGFLLGRTLAVLTTMTVGTSMAARQGPLAMAAHQICMQVWLAVSLLTDALAASAQALIAGSLSKSDYRTVREVTDFVLKIGLLTGISLAAILLISFGSLANMFTKDADVLLIVKTGVLFVSASQPLNALAYIFDGLHYGVSDFQYAACSMMLVGTISSAFLLFAPRMIGLPGVWLGLSLFMGLRTAAGYFRLSAKTGPWWFMHGEMQKFDLAG